MKGLPTLIRLRQRALDTLRRQLAELERQLEELMAEDRRLAEELERERAMAAEFPEMSSFYGNFAKGVEKKQLEIRLKAREVNQSIRKTRNEITEAFGELKRFEITRDNIAASEQEVKDKQEQQSLDEIAIQKFSRKNKEDLDS
jgi:flagellar export protein FliJ